MGDDTVRVEANQSESSEVDAKRGKKRRGRPRKSADGAVVDRTSHFGGGAGLESEDAVAEKYAEATAATIEIEEVTTSRPRRTGVRVAAKRAESEALASLVLLLFEGAAVATFGEPARFNEAEKAMILPPLSRILQRLPSSTVRAMQAWTDPLLLLFGLSLWFGRVWSARSAQAERSEPRKEEAVKGETTFAVDDRIRELFREV